MEGSSSVLINSESLDEAIKTCQRSTWLSSSRYGYIHVRTAGGAWAATINNVIVNDIGDGSTPTYGDVACSTIKLYAYNVAGDINPIVPSVQCLVRDDHRTPFLGHVDDPSMEFGTELSYPLILDAKVMSCVPTLFTILAKSVRLTDGNIAVRQTSSINLSSSFGLTSPDDLYDHIDFLLGCFAMLRNAISIISRARS